MGQGNEFYGAVVRGNHPVRRLTVRDRDTGVANAIGYAITGDWETPVGHGIIFGGGLKRIEEPVERFREAALNGDLRVWGRRTTGGLFELIEPSFWEDNTLNSEALISFMGQAKTIPFEGVETEERFYGLMVNRAEVERIWPHAG
jgi:hypothetical protein